MLEEKKRLLRHSVSILLIMILQPPVMYIAHGWLSWIAATIMVLLVAIIFTGLAWVYSNKNGFDWNIFIISAWFFTVLYLAEGWGMFNYFQEHKVITQVSNQKTQTVPLNQQKSISSDMNNSHNGASSEEREWIKIQENFFESHPEFKDPIMHGELASVLTEIYKDPASINKSQEQLLQEASAQVSRQQASPQTNITLSSNNLKSSYSSGDKYISESKKGGLNGQDNWDSLLSDLKKWTNVQPKQRQPKNSQPAPLSYQDRECNYKTVMTNEDYRACGINPPIQ